MDLLLLLAAFVIAFITMFVGAISGGVGLVLRPVLIFLGFPAVTVVASVRTAAIPGELPGLFLLHKHKKVDWKLTSFLIIPAFIGSLLASIAVLSIFKGWLEILIGIILLIVGIFLFVKRQFGLKERKAPFSNTSRKVLGFFGTLIISFFGIITGGLGPLYASFYMFVYGKSYISSSALWRIAIYLGSAVAAAVFIIGGAVDWMLFIALAIGFGLGSYLGTKYGLKKGEEWIRYIVLITIFASA